MTKLLLAKKDLDRVLNETSKSCFERVYLGLGRSEPNLIYVEELVECPNVSENPEISFIADPLCVYRTYKLAEERGLEVVLLVHSHPANPSPSTEDVRGMRQSGSLVWLIVSSKTGEYRAWRLVDGKPHEIEVIFR